MKTKVLAAILASFAAAAAAEGPPQFLKETYPTHALKAALQARGVLEGDLAQLEPKTRELIALAVSAQIPCAYCVYLYTKNARAKGASEEEIREAVATAATIRQWSTVLNGMAYDFEAFKSEVDKMHAKK